MATGQERCFAGAFQSEIIARAGHYPHLEQREDVTQQVLDWLTKTAA